MIPTLQQTRQPTRLHRGCVNCGKLGYDNGLCDWCQEHCPDMHENVLAEVERSGMSLARVRAHYSMDEASKKRASDRLPVVSYHKGELPECPHCTSHRGRPLRNIGGGRTVRECCHCEGQYRAERIEDLP